MDIFIKSNKINYLPFIQLQKDLDKHCALNGNVYVSVPAEEYNFFKRITGAGYYLYTDQEILESATSTMKYRDSWVTQQLIKLCCHTVFSNDACLALDSNTLINRNFDEGDFILNNRYVYELDETATENDLISEIRSSEFLKLPKYSPSAFRPVNQIFLKKNLEGLSDFLSNKFGKDYINVLYLSNGSRPPAWTEFNIYGIYSKQIAVNRQHWFGSKNKVLWFAQLQSPQKFKNFIAMVKEVKPLMIKFYKKRPHFEFSDTQYKRRVEEVKKVLRFA